MGYRRVPVIHTIDDVPDEEGFIYRMKSTSFGRVRRLLKNLDSDDDSSMEEIASTFVDHLVSWNLEDDNGPVEADADGVDEQDFDFILKLVNCWLDRLTGPDEDLGKGSTSGGKSPVALPKMEVL